MAPTKPLVQQQIEACFNIMGIPQIEVIKQNSFFFTQTLKLRCEAEHVGQVFQFLSLKESFDDTLETDYKVTGFKVKQSSHYKSTHASEDPINFLPFSDDGYDGRGGHQDEKRCVQAEACLLRNAAGQFDHDHFHMGVSQNFL